MRVKIDSDDSALPWSRALGLTLAVHELATNAAKYGALSGTAGEVRVSCRRSKSGALKVEWRESGGPLVKHPATKGFGSRLIEQIVPDYFGGAARLSFEPAGVRFRLSSAPAPGPD